ncbi:hypothetical protein N656DRAFT_437071 [Canariomyces notabilis]|uniref:Uncharacterized protein n=1 Tax=Canariomyces notabilis TaxID=2074819 RepID=A0AAN6QGH0_9PEZI|nr:hypothetical protein N656DRAFT_437071 [Canariomyces arenarius]
MKLVGAGGRLEAPLFRGDNMDSSSKAPWSSQGTWVHWLRDGMTSCCPWTPSQTGDPEPTGGHFAPASTSSRGTPARFEEPAGENAPHCSISNQGRVRVTQGFQSSPSWAQDWLSHLDFSSFSRPARSATQPGRGHSYGLWRWTACTMYRLRRKQGQQYSGA